MNDCARAQATQPWPLQTSLELAALTSAVPCARGHVRAVTAGWGLSSLSGTAELLVSELVTNAVKASRRLLASEGPAFVPVVLLALASDQTSLVIRVWDASGSMPVRTQAGPDEEAGRGLLLVEALGSEWGAYELAAGKVVWVLISPPSRSRVAGNQPDADSRGLPRPGPASLATVTCGLWNTPDSAGPAFRFPGCAWAR
jgi:anti-sigma regulatory factor (Ser/Thr protein kinase)